MSFNGSLPDCPSVRGDDPMALDGEHLVPSAPEADPVDVFIEPEEQLATDSISVSRDNSVRNIGIGAVALVAALALLDSQNARALVRRLQARILGSKNVQATIIAGAWQRAQETMTEVCPQRPLPTIGNIGDTFVTPGAVNEPWCQATAATRSQVDQVLLDVRRAADATRSMQLQARDLSLTVPEQTWLSRVQMSVVEVERGLVAMNVPTVMDAGVRTAARHARVQQPVRRSHVPTPSQPANPQGHTLRLAIPRSTPLGNGGSSYSAPTGGEVFGHLTDSNASAPLYLR